MSEKKLNEIIFYSDFFKQKDYIKDICDKYKKQILDYKENASDNFIKKLVKDTMKDYFNKYENARIDFRVLSVKLFYDELCDEILNKQKKRRNEKNGSLCFMYK